MIYPQAFQDIAPTHCYGCGSVNEHGHKFKSHWDPDTQKMICRWTPQPHHKAGPEIVYGGIIASLIDCQCGVMAPAAIYLQENRPFGDDPYPQTVTANLNIDYHAPLPLTGEIYSECWLEKSQGRKLHLACTVSHGQTLCAKGTALYIKLDK